MIGALLLRGTLGAPGERLGEGGDGGVTLVRRRERPIDDGPQTRRNGVRRRFVPRRRSGEKIVEYCAQTEYVTQLVGGTPREALGTGISIVSALSQTSLRVWLIPRKIETDKLDWRAVVLARRDENRVGRKGTVRDTESMRFLQPGSGLETDLHCLMRRQRALGREHFREELTVENLTRGIDPALRSFPYLQETRHVGVPYLASPSELLPEPRSWWKESGRIPRVPAESKEHEGDRRSGRRVPSAVKGLLARRAQSLEYQQATG
jgi:hypothetical protein